MHKDRPSVITAMNYDEAINRAVMASEFVRQPYWEIVSRMLSGTIQAETEQLLSGDDHMAVNRASVAICRKILQMPFIDIEQGNFAESERRKAYQVIEGRRFNRFN